MFSIRKRHKIQVLHGINTEVSTPDIDALRISRSHEQIKSRSETIANLIDLTPLVEITKQINTYFSKRGNTLEINGFFKNHPQVFSDLIRVIHKNRVNDSTQGWHIPSKKISEIEQVFLFRDRQSDIGTHIPEYVKVVCNNQEFIEFASKQTSILDVNSYEFSQIPEKDRNKKIRNLIIVGLVSNIAGCTEKNIEQYFGRTKERIFCYLNEIFGINLSSISHVQTIDQLTQKLSELFKTGKGNDRKKAWKVIQAFHAWGDIIGIENEYAETMVRCEEVPKKLAKHGLILIGEITNTIKLQGAIMCSARYTFEDYNIEVSWRAKHPKSILKKLWETEEYVRSSTVRDELGISFTYEDTTPQDIIVSLMQVGSMMMSHHGYILKNKGELDDENIFRKVSTETKKKPLFAEHKSGGDPKMKNASQSGFMSLGEGKNKRAIGCEIQYSKKSAKQWKEQDDPIYKFRGAIDALMRGAHQASPKEIFDAITREIQETDIGQLSDPNIGKSLGLKNYNDIIVYLIEVKKILLPYFGKTGGKYILLFTTPTHKNEFEKRWKMEYLEKNKSPKKQKRYSEMSTVIKALEQTH